VIFSQVYHVGKTIEIICVDNPWSRQEGADRFERDHRNGLGQ
jgi:hypothetical protein